MVSKVDRTVDRRDFKKKIATVATSRLSIFRGFCCGLFHRISVAEWKNSYKMASKSSKTSVK
jgi:hypothetical protein